MRTGLFFDKRTLKYFYVGKDHCDRCSRELQPNSFLITYHSLIERKSYAQLCCHKCLKKRQEDICYAAEIRKVIIIDRDYLPATAYSIPVQRLYLGDRHDLEGSLTTWAAQGHKEILSDAQGVKIKDHTRLANKETWEGSQIGLAPESIPDKRLLLSAEQAERLLIEFTEEAEP